MMVMYTILRTDGNFLSYTLKSFSSNLDKAYKTDNITQAYNIKDELTNNCVVWEIVV